MIQGQHHLQFLQKLSRGGGDKAGIEKIKKNKKIQIIVPVSQRTAVILVTHTKAHWGITKTAKTIADKMREDVRFVLQCTVCLEKQGVNLKEGEHTYPGYPMNKGKLCTWT